MMELIHEHIDIIGLIGTIGTVLGIFFSFYFFKKSVKKKKLCWQVFGFKLFDDEVNKLELLEVRYCDEPINQLFVSFVTFWNAGRETLNPTDFPSEDRFKIHSREGIKIFDAEIVKFTDISIGVSLKKEPDESVIDINFEYLDFNHGAIIKVLHSGNSSGDIYLTGVVKGAGKIKQLTAFVNPDEKNAERLPLGSFIITTVLFLLITLAVNSIVWKFILGFFTLALFVASIIKALETKPPKLLDS